MKVISLGLGVQSTALYYMSSMGILPRCDYAIFSDLGKEKEETYKYLEFLLRWEQENNGIPIIVCDSKNLYLDLLNSVNSTNQRFSSIPAFTKNSDGSIGMLRRQCTYEYKIAVVDSKIREIQGKKPRQRLLKTEVWKGISLDEIDRISNAKEAWKVCVHPFVGFNSDYKNIWKTELLLPERMDRNTIEKWFVSMALPIPPKSSCIFCPYQSDKSYKDMKENHPFDFEAAIAIDEAIRNSSKKGINNPIYLHRSCVPLKDIIFKDDAPDLWSGECSGTCHN